MHIKEEKEVKPSLRTGETTARGIQAVKHHSSSVTVVSGLTKQATLTPFFINWPRSAASA